MCKYLDQFRPRTLADVVGQPDAVRQLTTFALEPYPAALLFSGPTGTGKTCAARALAAELGVDVDRDEFGGLHAIASGEQTAESVRQAIAALRTRPFCGSGWKVLIVNECDRMSDAAAFVWLDALEDLPNRAVVIFTTNDPGKLPARLRDRCERVAFTGDALALRPAAQELLNRLWAALQPGTAAPAPGAFPGLVENGLLSFRRLIQLATPFLRSGTTPQPPAAPVQPQPPGLEDRETVLARCRQRAADAAKKPEPKQPAADPAYADRLNRQRDEIIARLTSQPAGV